MEGEKMEDGGWQERRWQGGGAGRWIAERLPFFAFIRLHFEFPSPLPFLHVYVRIFALNIACSMKITMLSLAGSLLALAACRTNSAVEQSGPDIRGAITGIIPSKGSAPGVAGFIRVEGKRDSTTHYDKAAITVTDSTSIIRADGARGAFADLHEGDSVEASFTGPVRESYPVQATARNIIIMAR